MSYTYLKMATTINIVSVCVNCLGWTMVKFFKNYIRITNSKCTYYSLQGKSNKQDILWWLKSYQIQREYYYYSTWQANNFGHSYKNSLTNRNSPPEASSCSFNRRNVLNGRVWHPHSWIIAADFITVTHCNNIIGGALNALAWWRKCPCMLMGIWPHT